MLDDDVKCALIMATGVRGIEAAHGDLRTAIAYISVDVRAGDERLGVAPDLGSDEGSGKRTKNDQSGDMEVDAVQSKGWGKKGFGKNGAHTDSTKGGKNGKGGKSAGKTSWHVGKNSWSTSGSAWKSWDNSGQGPEKSEKDKSHMAYWHCGKAGHAPQKAQAERDPEAREAYRLHCRLRVSRRRGRRASLGWRRIGCLPSRTCRCSA